MLRDLEVVLLDVGPEALECLGAGDLRCAHDCLQRRGDGLRLGDAGRPFLLRGRLCRSRGLGRGGRRAHDDGCGRRAPTRRKGGGGGRGGSEARDRGGRRRRATRRSAWRRRRPFGARLCGRSLVLGLGSDNGEGERGFGVLEMALVPCFEMERKLLGSGNPKRRPVGGCPSSFPEGGFHGQHIVTLLHRQHVRNTRWKA